MKLTLDQIRERAAFRPPGYVEDVIRRGVLAGSVLTLSAAAYRELCAKYGGPSHPLPPLVPCEHRTKKEIVKRCCGPTQVLFCQRDRQWTSRTQCAACQKNERNSVDE